jgi:Putative Flp pilus-assembly TadE/G-like
MRNLNGFQNLRRDERGMSLVFVSVGFMAFLSATTLAIDVGMFMNARSQAQNAADAGAHAGAVALVFNSYTNRTPTGPVVQSALNAALANKVAGGLVSIGPDDVTFPLDPTGQADRVAVQVFRTVERGNPVPTLMGAFFGVQRVNITATATAEAARANAMTCVKPFMIPDKWIEKNSPANGTYDKYDKKNNLLPDADVYHDAMQSNYTGYTTENDAGTSLTLRAGTGDEVNPSFYFSWKMPGDTGGDFYRDNIANCNQSVMHWNDKIIQEPGDKTGPTIQGIQALIDKDPNARWDNTCKCVKDSAFAISPRVFPIPLYDPEFYADGKANGRVADFRIANFLGFFAMPPTGNKIPGIITQIVGLVDDTAPAPPNTFAKAIRLVQ